MKKIITGIMVFVLSLSSLTFGKVEYQNKNIDNHNIQIIRVELDGEHYVVASSSNFGESLETLVNRQRGVAGVNGAFFQPQDYAGFDKNSTNADRIVNGRKDFSYGGDLGARGMFGFKKDGTPLFIANNYGYTPGGIGKHNEEKVGEVFNGISNHPILLVDGKDVYKQSTRGVDLFDRVKNTGLKTFICSTKNNKEVLMGSVGSISLANLPKYLKDSLGCHNAIGLDAGGSRGLIYNNNYVLREGRPIMDAFVVVEKDNYLGNENVEREPIENPQKPNQYKINKPDYYDNLPNEEKIVYLPIKEQEIVKKYRASFRELLVKEFHYNSTDPRLDKIFNIIKKQLEKADKELIKIILTDWLNSVDLMRR